jgi:hypothetical protein
MPGPRGIGSGRLKTRRPKAKPRKKPKKKEQSFVSQAADAFLEGFKPAGSKRSQQRDPRTGKLKRR